ncbi:MAG: hypothetical protein JW742_00700 [Candidatus Aminicenantes bacterium]|nr:hypothetical protein [Candidatus Aminicenantes bacterium]
MSKSRVIRVTPNLIRCLQDLKAALKDLPPGESRTRAKGALDYLARTFAGEPQPGRGLACDPPRIIVR